MKKSIIAFALVVALVSASATTTLTITVNIPDADVTDSVAALREVYATNGLPNPSQAQIQAAMKAEWVARLRAIVKAYRARLLSAGAAEPAAN